MSSPEHKLETFIFLLQERLILFKAFSAQELTDLKERVSQLPNNVEELSKGVNAWLQDREQLREIYERQLNRVLLAGKNPPPNPDNNKDYQKLLEKLLDNAIKRNSPPPPQSPSSDS